MTAVCEHEAARRARSLEAHGFRRAAIDVLKATLAQQPDVGTLWALRALLLSRQGRHDEAFADIQKALILAPLGPEELLVLAHGYERAGFLASAVDVYQQLAADNDRPYELWPAIFVGFCRLRRWHDAARVSREAAETRPDDDGAYYALARALSQLGRPAKVIVGVLCKAIHLNPNDARYRVLLATQFLRLGDQQEAYKCISSVEPEEFADLACACCAWKLLRLCVSFGDAPRAALFGAQLAHLSSAAQAAREKGEPS